MTVYFRAAVEILTNPHGTSVTSVEGAIAALQAHLDVVRRAPKVLTIEDREAEADAIAQAEGWVRPGDIEPPIYDEDGSIAYAQMLERQAEMSVAAEEAAYGPGWGVTY